MIRIREAQEAPFFQARSVAFLTQKIVSFWDADGESYVAIPRGESEIPGVILSQAYHAFGPEIYNPKQEKASWPNPGSVSHGTMRAEDLIPAFMFLLEEHDREAATKLTSSYSEEGWPYSMAGLAFGDPFDEVQQEFAPHFLEDLFNALNEIAPPGTYFGAHVGDGSDYGFWSHEEDDLQAMLQDLGVEVSELGTGSFVVRVMVGRYKPMGSMQAFQPILRSESEGMSLELAEEYFDITLQRLLRDIEMKDAPRIVS